MFTSPEIRGALEDITILDLTRVLAGPYCGMLLSDMGAKTIKIEIPGKGDDSRSYGPFKNGESIYYANLNRNKKGITLDLKKPEGKKILLELVKKADVLIENYRPGVMDKLGLGYDVLKEVNEQLIYAAVSGFGCYGPYSQKPGYDIIAQAMGGLMSVTGQPNDPPTRAGNAMGDILGGMNLTIGILAALNARHITKKGQRVDVSLVDSVVASMETAPQRYFMDGHLPKRMGNRYAAIAPYDCYACKDGHFVLGCGNQKLFEKFCNDVIKMPELIIDERFQDVPLRVKFSDDFQVIVEGWAKDYTVQELVGWLDKEGLPVAPIYTIKDIVEDEHIANAREMFIPFSHPIIGKIKVNGCPIKLMDTKTTLRYPAPILGQHNKEIMTEFLYYTEEEYNKLVEKQVF